MLKRLVCGQHEAVVDFNLPRQTLWSEHVLSVSVKWYSYGTLEGYRIGPVLMAKFAVRISGETICGHVLWSGLSRPARTGSSLVKRLEHSGR
jgi:hypothetical protein